jgi:hypothetical protein
MKYVAMHYSNIRKYYQADQSMITKSTHQDPTYDLHTAPKTMNKVENEMHCY